MVQVNECKCSPTGDWINNDRPMHGILFSNKQEWTTDPCDNMGKLLKYVKCKELNTQDYKLYYPTYTKHPEKTNL